MKNILKILVVYSLVMCFYQTLAQTPINDPAWHLQTYKSDEFNGSYLDTTSHSTIMWYSHDWGGFSGWSAEYNSSHQLSFTGTTIKIKFDTIQPSTSYQLWANSSFHTPTSASHVYVGYLGGTIYSQQDSGSDLYKYGYIEISAKYPSGYYDPWPAFWLYSASGTCPSTSYYNEIDIGENGSPNSHTGTVMGTNMHVRANCSVSQFDNGEDISLGFNISAAFHKYAVEWEPTWITWYIDDVPVRTYSDPTGVNIPQNPMAVILDLATDPWNSWVPEASPSSLTDWNTISHPHLKPTHFPQYFEIDYVRYYKLLMNCSNSLHICTPSTDYVNRPVESSITVAGSCSTTFNTSDEYTLRAVNSVTLGNNTTINSNGSGFFAVETYSVCPH